jgi:hypothetical protein
MEVSDQLYCPAALSLGKELLYLLDRELDGLQRRPELGGEEQNLLSLTRIETQFFGRQPVV